MPRELDQDELMDRWTLISNEPELVATKRGAAKIGFALMLRFYTENGRFPRGRSEIHDDAVKYVARQIGINPTEIAFYDFTGPTSKAHRVQIRELLAFRECSVADAETLTRWLVDNVTQAQRGANAVRDHLLARCRTEKIEPPTGGRVDRSALSLGEDLLFERVSSRLTREVADRMLASTANTAVAVATLRDLDTLSITKGTLCNTAGFVRDLSEVEEGRPVSRLGDVFLQFQAPWTRLGLRQAFRQSTQTFTASARHRYLDRRRLRRNEDTCRPCWRGWERLSASGPSGPPRRRFHD